MLSLPASLPPVLAISRIIPYGAQLLVASSLAGITATSIVPYSIYQVLVAVAALISIALAGRDRAKKPNL